MGIDNDPPSMQSLLDCVVTVTGSDMTQPMPKLRRSINALLISALYTCTCSATPATTHRVKVNIIGRESTIHTSVSNRDVYLIHVTPRSGKQFVAKMIDEYPAYEETLPFASLSEGALFSVALRSTPYCNSGSGDELSSEPMRCFAVIHGSWKISKGVAKDEWWK